MTITWCWMTTFRSGMTTPLSASQAVRLHLPEAASQFRHEQFGLLECRKMPTLVDLTPVHDMGEVLLRPAP
jgi:hypothetical protein